MFKRELYLVDQLNCQLDVLRAVRREYKPDFQAYYVALRLTRSARLDDLQLLMSFSPDKEKDHCKAYGLAQIQSLFKKRSDVDVGIDVATEALKSFLVSETRCREMNEALRNTDDPHYRDRAALIHEMQRKISALLGPCPDPATLDYGFGPGSSVGCSKITNVEHKLSAPATLTVDAIPLLKRALGTSHVWWPGLSNLRVICAARFSTVPKSWKTDRGILVEGIVNTFLQKGIGSHIRDRLRQFAGINLRDQSRNKSLALVGSRTGGFATIDLSQASDSISSFLVLDLLPPDWFDLLYACRSHRVELPDGSIVDLEKFSSMGNGYTFELESLIFWAVCSCVCCPGEEFSVYGDDIIVPTVRADAVISALSLLGFRTNVDKTFTSGPFRESCGGDYFGGIDVRPFFLRSSWTVADVIRLHNFCVRTGRLSELIPVLLRYIPRRAQNYGPDGVGDGHLIGDNFPVHVDKRGWGHFIRYKTFVPRPFKVDSSEEARFCAFLYYTTYRRLGELVFDDIVGLARPRFDKYELKTLIHFCHFGNPSGPGKAR